jgi:hypothetical protein
MKKMLQFIFNSTLEELGKSSLDNKNLCQDNDINHHDCPFAGSNILKFSEKWEEKGNNGYNTYLPGIDRPDKNNDKLYLEDHLWNKWKATYPNEQKEVHAAPPALPKQEDRKERKKRRKREEKDRRIREQKEHEKRDTLFNEGYNSYYHSNWDTL